MADDPLTAALAPIRARSAYLLPLYQNPGFMLDQVIQDVPRLLAAIDAALELADGWEEGSFRLDAGAVVMDTCARELREAITRKLTGKEDSDR